MRVAQLLAAAGVFVGVNLSSPSYAQNGLPPEARARIILTQIEDALNARPPNEKGALAKLRELDGAGVARPNSLFITEAKLAARAKDYPRAKTALDRYFKVAATSDPNYNEAAAIYSAVGEIEAKAKAQTDASDAEAWRAAQASNSCAGYNNYLRSLNTPNRFVLESDERAGALGCPELTGAQVSPQIFATLYAKPMKAGGSIPAAEPGRVWRAAIDKSQGSDTWSIELFDESKNRADFLASCSRGGSSELSGRLWLYDMRFPADTASAYHTGIANAGLAIGGAEGTLKGGWIKSWGNRPAVGGQVDFGIVGYSFVTSVPTANAYVRVSNKVFPIDSVGTRLLYRLVTTCFR